MFLTDIHCQEEYSKTIDSSTVLAILSDYNLSDSSELVAAQQLLSALSSEVVADEIACFDPSGASGPGLVIDDQEIGRGENESVMAKSHQGWRSQADDTSLSQEMSVLDLEGFEFSDNGVSTSKEESPEKPLSSELDGLDEEGKEEALVAIFPALKPFDVKWMLKKFKGDANRAIDELMTQSFLEESGSRHRGIEAFSESELPLRQRKGKGKKRHGLWTDDDTRTAASVSLLQSKWETGRQDVEFIANKTGMPIQQVGSIYHTNGASVRTTIAAIIDAHASMKIESDDPVIQINTSELRQDFPSISTSDLKILVQITHPSVNNARELAKALISTPVANQSIIHVEFRHAPIDLRADPVNSKPKIPNGLRSAGSVATAELASSYIQARDMAFIQAHAAYRKGKSDSLMGGAAAYYSQVGRDNDAKAKIAKSAAADALVSTQSSRTELDLHGVSVKDAVRISRERVTAWWHELGEGKVGGQGVGAGYRIVTGMGNHSEGRRGKLGPAVGKMLIREGWSVQVGSGVLVVTGIAKKR
jgi:hypothetical protein